MTCTRSVVLIGAVMLAIAAVVPGQAISQEAGIAGTSDLAVGAASRAGGTRLRGGCEPAQRS